MNAAAVTIGNTGSSQSHENMPPFLTVNFSIALVGLYPSRN
jgi:microcystin-dependent protein